MTTEFSFTLLEILASLVVLIMLIYIYQTMAPEWFNKTKKPYSWVKGRKMGLVSKDLLILESAFEDKVRFYNFWLQFERLKRNNIGGAIAEVGVYKGETAKILHALDPNRKLLLFDTFEGFTEEDLQNETGSIPNRKFEDTNLTQVQEYINGNDNVEYITGWFPQSAEGIREREFALVNLDADLYNPTISGLKYFYDKLCPGGVIIIHDYQHIWPGVTKAVDEFIAEKGLNLVEIPDSMGTALIFKQ